MTALFVSERYLMKDTLYITYRIINNKRSTKAPVSLHSIRNIYTEYVSIHIQIIFLID
jgi:hypothetical protein